MNLDSANQKNATPVSSGKFSPLAGVVDTAIQSIGNLNGAWEFQLLNNMDELSAHLRSILPAEEYAKISFLIETLVKQPLRRQMGRIRSIGRSLEEIKRHIHSGV